MDTEECSGLLHSSEDFLSVHDLYNASRSADNSLANPVVIELEVQCKVLDLYCVKLFYSCLLNSVPLLQHPGKGDLDPVEAWCS